jgi:hypothetical protein
MSRDGRATDSTEFFGASPCSDCPSHSYSYSYPYSCSVRQDGTRTSRIGSLSYTAAFWSTHLWVLDFRDGR